MGNPNICWSSGNPCVISTSAYDWSEARSMRHLLSHNTDRRQSQHVFMVGWTRTCTQVNICTETHMHGIVSNWINAWAKALQMQVIAYSLFHWECAQWIKHLWINTYIHLNITLWIHYRLLLRFCLRSYPFTHYSLISDVSIFLHLSFSISPFTICQNELDYYHHEFRKCSLRI